MAVGDLTLFNDFTRQLAEKEHDLADDTFKLGLITNATAPLVGDTTPLFTEYTEVTGDNYTAGGIDVSGSMAVTLAGAVATWDIVAAGPQASWLQHVTGPTDIRWGILYNNAGTKIAVAFVDFGGGSDISLRDGDIKYTFNATAIATITRS